MRVITTRLICALTLSFTGFVRADIIQHGSFVCEETGNFFLEFNRSEVDLKKDRPARGPLKIEYMISLRDKSKQRDPSDGYNYRFTIDGERMSSIYHNNWSHSVGVNPHRL